jgi:hypothetical protein
VPGVDAAAASWSGLPHCAQEDPSARSHATRDTVAAIAAVMR